MRGALAAGIAEVLLLTSLTLADVTAARMMPAIAKVELIIEDTPKLKAKWQNDINVFLVMNASDRRNAFDLFCRCKRSFHLLTCQAVVFGALGKNAMRSVRLHFVTAWQPCIFREHFTPAPASST